MSKSMIFHHIFLNRVIFPQPLNQFRDPVSSIGSVGSLVVYLSLLNCAWPLIREVQWFYRTQKLLVQAEKCSVRMPTVRLELAIPRLSLTLLFQAWTIWESCLRKLWWCPRVNNERSMAQYVTYLLTVTGVYQGLQSHQGIIMLKLKRKLKYHGYRYYESVCSPSYCLWCPWLFKKQ